MVTIFSFCFGLYGKMLLLMLGYVTVCVCVCVCACSYMCACAYEQARMHQAHGVHGVCVCACTWACVHACTRICARVPECVCAVDDKYDFIIVKYQLLGVA